MDTIGITLFASAAVAQVVLPRRLAVLPLLMTVAWTTRGLTIELADIEVSALRVVIVLALLRATLQGLSPAGGVQGVDRLWLVWALLLLGSAAFHTDDRLQYRIGLVWDYLGSYAVIRLFVQDAADVRRLFALMGLVFVPVALLMLREQAGGHNLFGQLGGVPVTASARENGFRASGPFAHALMAGAVGATLMPMAAALWRHHRALALTVSTAGAALLWASASSGPLLMLAAAAVTLMVWRARQQLGWFLAALFAVTVGLQVVMNDPVYFLIARVDVVGGSTGWHRAQLIHAALQHLDDWWLYGTDYTRHWMPTGIVASEVHTDITNHYLAFGVLGGLPLMASFVGVLAASMHSLAGTARRAGVDDPTAFLSWTMLVIVVAHAVNFLGCWLFDQSIVSLIVVLGAAQALRHSPPGRPDSSTRLTPRQRVRPGVIIAPA